MKSVGLSLAAMALIGDAQAVKIARKVGNVELLDRDVFEENDNSDDFMAESIAEAEKENKDGKMDLTAKIAELDADQKAQEAQIDKDEHDPTPKSKELKQKINSQAQSLIEDALGSASVVKFNGKETEVKTTDAMAEVSASVTEKKVAIRQALEDIDDEMGVKHEKKVAAI